jgi:predicted phosphodiesterase
MRLAVFADIHGNLIAFETMLADLATVGEVDLLWCLGDLAAFGARPAECVARLRTMQEQYGEKKFYMIGGNTDRYLVTGERMTSPPAKDADGLQRRIAAYSGRDAILNWNLARLTWEDYELLTKINGRELHRDIEGYGTIIGVHAVPGSDESMSLKPDSSDEEAADALLDRGGRLALAGHTHLAMDRFVRGWRVVNPGSVGMSFSNPGYAEWALLTFEGDDVTVDLRAVPYAVDAALDDAAAAGYPDLEFIRPRLTQKPA